MSMVNLECPVNLILYGGLFSERKPQIVHTVFFQLNFHIKLPNITTTLINMLLVENMDTP